MTNSTRYRVKVIPEYLHCSSNTGELIIVLDGASDVVAWRDNLYGATSRLWQGRTDRLTVQVIVIDRQMRSRRDDIVNDERRDQCNVT